MTWQDLAFCYGVTIGVSALACLVAAVMFITVGTRWKILDPGDARRPHDDLIVRAAGPALYVGFAAGLLLVISQWPALWQERYLALLAAGLLMLILGLYDDLFRLPRIVMLGGQIVAACLLVANGYQMTGLNFPFLPEYDLHQIAGSLLSILFIVAIINIVNLLEGLKGWPALPVLILCAFLFYVKSRYGTFNAAASLACLTGTLFGSLLANVGQTRFLLGNSGSLVIGLFAAAELLNTGAPHMTLSTLALPLVILFLPAFSLARQTAQLVRRTSAPPSFTRLHRELTLLNAWLPTGRATTDQPLPGSVSHRLTFALVAILVAAALLAAGYPRWQSTRATLLAADGGEPAIYALLDEGKTDQALAVARLVHERNPLDPKASYLYAKTLIETGGTANGIRQLESAFSIDHIPNPNYDPDRPATWPATLPTNRPWFYASARLEMARVLLNEFPDSLRAALTSIELARAYGQELPDRYRSILIDAYSRSGDWMRLFQVVTPTQEELAAMPREAIEAHMRFTAATEDWKACLETAQHLLASEKDDPDALLWMAKSYLALGDTDLAKVTLDRAFAAGPGEAAFYIGYYIAKTPEEVVASLLKTPADSSLRAFALARAIRVISIGESNSHEEAAALQELQNMIAIPPTIGVPFTPEGPAPYLLGITPLESPSRDTTYFPAFVYWSDPRLSPPGSPVVYVISPEHFVLRLGNRLVEYRWLSNLAPYGDFYGFNKPPGWATAFANEATISNVDAGTRYSDDVVFVTSGESMSSTRYLSPPIQIQSGNSYLFAIRCESIADTRLVAGLRWLDDSENTVFEQNIFNQERVTAMVWRGLNLRAPEARYVQALIGVFEDAGTAVFDAVYIIPLSAPVLPD